MEQEIDAAVQWWGDILRARPAQDTGDALSSVFGTVVARGLPPLTAAHIMAFQAALRDRLRARCAESWKPEEPPWGAALRCIGCDYGPDPLLADAAQEAGIGDPSPYFPMKTMMWIDPGSVHVRHGYGAPITSIYGG